MVLVQHRAAAVVGGKRRQVRANLLHACTRLADVQRRQSCSKEALRCVQLLRCGWAGRSDDYQPEGRHTGGKQLCFLQ